MLYVEMHKNYLLYYTLSPFSIGVILAILLGLFVKTYENKKRGKNLLKHTFSPFYFFIRNFVLPATLGLSIFLFSIVYMWVCTHPFSTNVPISVILILPHPLLILIACQYTLLWIFLLYYHVAG
jgi:hypothetical protein